MEDEGGEGEGGRALQPAAEDVLRRANNAKENEDGVRVARLQALKHGGAGVL